MREIPAQQAVPVLVAEDDPDMCSLVRHLLYEQGYMIHEVADGHAALAFLGKQVTPHIVIVEDDLPDLSGIALLHFIANEYPRAMRHASILLTASFQALTVERQHLYQALRVQVLYKPFSMDTLLTAVDRAKARLEHHGTL